MGRIIGNKKAAGTSACLEPMTCNLQRGTWSRKCQEGGNETFGKDVLDSLTKKDNLLRILQGTAR